MGTTIEKFSKYIDEGSELLKRYKIDSISSLVNNYKNNPEFDKDWKALWGKIYKENNGKLGWTTVGVIFGAMLGGVGIAAMGGAIGLPLYIVLGLGGWIFGSSRDSRDSSDFISIKISKITQQKIEANAKQTNMSIDEFLEFLLTQYSKEEFN